RVDESLEPVIASQLVTSGLGDIPPGRVAGVRQVVRGYDEVRERITLTLEIAVGAQDLGDEVQISGVPDLAVMVPGGFPGDLATAAVVVNSVVQVAAARPGLLTMLDLPPPRVGV